MKYVRFASSLFPLAGAVLLFSLIIAWQPDTAKIASTNHYQKSCDTTVPKSADLNQIDIQINMDSVMQQVNLALSKIDYAKMNADIQKAMAQIDYTKMNLEVNKAMKEIDWKKMNMDVSKALDSAKMAVNKINWDEMKADLSHAQTEAKKAAVTAKINVDSIRIQVQESLRDAQKSLHNAQTELRNYKGLTSDLEKDGLVEINKPYHIQLKEGILYINGIRQNKTITDKYSQYYQNKKNFSIGDDGADL